MCCLLLKSLFVALLPLLALSKPVPHQRHHPDSVARAIYVITNGPSNGVVALPVGQNGMLSAGTVTPTGGMGSNSLDSTDQPAAPDPLVSQGALVVVGNIVFAVNAGSNTLSMLRIDPRNPTALSMVGAPISLPGEFPNTVAASAKHRLVCVGMTGTVNGVSCSTFSRQGLSPMDSLRTFDLTQTTPPRGPLNTVSQVFFSDDESRLFASVKGDPTVNNTGFFSVFPVQTTGHRGTASLATQDIRSSPSGTAVLFGSANIPGTSNVFVTDASFGGAVLSIDSTSNTASLVSKQVIADQKATCWVTVSTVSGSAFVTDVAINRVIEMSLTDATILSTTNIANSDPGLIDLKAAGNFVYALSPGNGTTPAAITVLDISGGPGTAETIQHFAIDSMGVDKNAQGMAVLM